MKPLDTSTRLPTECPDLQPGDPLDADARDWIKRRIQSLRSKASAAGPFRRAGIQRTIAGMKAQLKDGRWRPHAGRPGSTTDDV